MRSRLALGVMFVSSLTFLVSLYLPWATVGTPVCHGAFPCTSASTLSGWTLVGDAAAIVAVAVAASALAALVRPSLAERLPLGAVALLLLYVAIAGLVLDWHNASYFSHTQGGAIVWHFGAYLALWAAVVTVLSAWLLRDIAMPGTTVDVFAWAVGFGLLVAFLLPWHRVAFGGQQDTVTGVGSATDLVAGLVLLGLSRQRLRAPCWAGAVLFTIAGHGFGVNPYGVSTRVYGFWLALGLALAVLAFAALSARAQEWSITAPRGRGAFVVAAAALYVVSLFLPWQQLCVQGDACYTTAGWGQPGSTAALLAGIAALALLLGIGELWLPELAAGFALLVVSAGMYSPFYDDAGVHFKYGAIFGFCVAAFFVAATIAPLRVEPRRVTIHLVPIATTALLVAAITIPWWNVLPRDWESSATALTGWLAVAGLLLSVHLLFAWMRSATDVVLVPLGVLALVVVDAILGRSVEPSWGSCIAGGLCLVLAAFGWAEQRGGVPSLRVPDEIWRVDRISPVED